MGSRPGRQRICAPTRRTNRLPRDGGQGDPFETLADLLVRSAELYGSHPAVRFKEGGAWVDRSFQQVLDIVKPLSLG